MIDESRIFDEKYYLKQNPDVANAVSRGDLPSAVEHFQAFGRAEGRSPNSFFDADTYLRDNLDVAQAIEGGAVESAWSHFVQFGAGEDRAPNRVFDAAAYRAANPDVDEAVEAGVFDSAFEHFAGFGAKENRDLGNGVNLGDFANDSKFQRAAESDATNDLLARIAEVAPFLPGFADRNLEALEDILEDLTLDDLPDDFEGPDGLFQLFLPPGLQGRDDLPPPFRRGEDGDSNLPPGLRGRDDLPPAFGGRRDDDDRDDDDDDDDGIDVEPEFSLTFEAGVLQLENQTPGVLEIEFSTALVTAEMDGVSTFVPLPDDGLAGIEGITVVTNADIELELEADFDDGESLASLSDTTADNDGTDDGTTDDDADGSDDSDDDGSIDDDDSADDSDDDDDSDSDDDDSDDDDGDSVLLEPGSLGVLTLAGEGSVLLAAEEEILDGFTAIDAGALGGSLVADLSDAGFALTVTGGAGDDLIETGEAGATLNASAGRDTYILGDGADTLVYTGGEQSFDGADVSALDTVEEFDAAADSFDFGVLGTLALRTLDVDGEDLASLTEQAFKALEANEAGAFTFEGDTFLYAKTGEGDAPAGGDLMVKVLGLPELTEDSVVLAA